ncbi:hypothetical protein M3223_13435 [Paenibacillus pasadenensis]|uniref:hypothetical protein n=1 Tax=Paenibacillus pasadenensis TaxID=217090 RepID=UPI00203B6BE9|nr:hypothetical protein [Paenibacillus pasadenensis]MCM3748353.1 hypothetical protein [Paenibacillus pasadenensis]
MKLESNAITAALESSTKYPLDVMSALRAHLGEEPASTTADETINNIPKAQVMDTYLSSKGNPNDRALIWESVDKIFWFSLDKMSENNEGNLLSSYNVEVMQHVRNALSGDSNNSTLDSQIMSMKKNDVMEKFLESYGSTITGADARRIINYIFGVNLDGISALERSRLTLYSKGDYELLTPTDIFIVSSNKGDVSLFVGVTEYFTQQTGLDSLPQGIATYLEELGFALNPETKKHEYHNSTAESVSDPFKGQVIFPVVNYIKDHYAKI